MLILKWVSNKYDVRKQTVFNWLMIGVVTRSGKYGNEASDSIRSGIFFVQLSEYQHVKQNSFPQICFSSYVRVCGWRERDVLAFMNF
jgi:hypothetical protein